MKFLIILSLAFIAASAEKSLDVFLNIRDGTCTEKCTSDCTGMVVCRNGKEITIDCKKQTGDAPYCNSKTMQCVKTLDNCTPGPSPTTPCDASWAGMMYPDILNCQHYFFCDGTNAASFVCPATTRYNPKTTMCELNIPCNVFDSKTGLCKGREGVLLPHPLDATFYVACTATTPELFYCEAENFEFDPKTANCEFVCRKAGRFKDGTDTACQRYFECIKNGSFFLKTRNSCPTGFIFVDKDSNGTGKCVKSDDNNKCPGGSSTNKMKYLRLFALL